MRRSQIFRFRLQNEVDVLIPLNCLVRSSDWVGYQLIRIGEVPMG